MLLLSPSYVHATVNTPAEPAGARVARFPAAGSLPRNLGGSASASILSRPAQRSLHVVACTLAEPPKAVLFHRSASVRFVTSSNRSDCYRLERQLPGGLRIPLRHSAFPRRTKFRKLWPVRLVLARPTLAYPPVQGVPVRAPLDRRS